ncbi:MAG TPA: radical SAM protein, partial [Candidatus Kapabacteria bacterium]|nr:radical SAM protein [Candidatus Kapabacteria bacterium]
MLKSKPFLVEFESRKGNKYAYDVVTNGIFPVSDIILEILRDFKNFEKDQVIEVLSQRYPKTEVEKSYQKVAKWVKYEGAFFSTNDLQIGRMPSETQFKTYLSNCPHIILVPTNQCNLRCKYCAFSGDYPNNRIHNDDTMSLDIAIKTIDYFLYNIFSSDRRNCFGDLVTIGFYGGECLLQFPLIKECIEYVKSIGYENNVFWNLSTNGTLLTEEKIRYFLKMKKIKISISVDGFQDQHDRHRVFNGGIGSFEIIAKNLERLFSLDPEFYKKNIHFQPVLPKYNDPFKLVDFFMSYPLVRENTIASQIGGIAPGADSFYTDLNAEDEKVFLDHYSQLFQKHLEMLKAGDVNSREFEILLALSGNILYKVHNRLYRHIDTLSFTTGTCIPGGRKIFVAPNGSFHICERVTEKNSIGDCFSGVDYQKCKTVYEKYINAVTTDCRNCENLHFCSICFSNAEKESGFDPGDYCVSSRQNLKNILSDYYS